MTSALPYHNLHDAADKAAFIQAVRKIRRDLLRVADSVPPDQWHSPRYHDWSLATMLGHLQVTDTLAHWVMRASLSGIRLPLPLRVINGFNDLMAPLLGKRVVSATRQRLESNEAWIVDFIMQLPPEKLDTPVYSVLHQRFIPLEQGVQLYYLFHWHDHYRTMRQVDGIFYEPPNSTVV